MSKAVLVIDMPKRCKDCFRYRADPWFGGSCTQAKDENGWNKHIDADDEYSVQNWCPLRPYQETIPVEWIKKWKEKAADGSLYRGPLDLYDHCEYEAAIDRLLSDWEEENE